jgi:hypothetical protein
MYFSDFEEKSKQKIIFNITLFSLKHLFCLTFLGLLSISILVLRKDALFHWFGNTFSKQSLAYSSTVRN